MRFFGRKRQTPTDEQRRRLARISNPGQRRTLLAAIERGETVPDYAWTPFSEEIGQTSDVAELHEQLLQYAESSGRDVMEVIASISPSSHIQFYADKARETATADTGYLCLEPIHVHSDLVATADNATGILFWGIFNPYGPTLYFLSLVGVSEQAESLLYFTRVNPFQCQNLVYGIIPDSIRADYLNDIVDDLVTRHATGEFGLFPASLPSFLMPLSRGIAVYELTHKGFRHVSAEDVRTECELLRRIPNDPWKMATEMRRRGLTAALQERQDGFADASQLRHDEASRRKPAAALDEWLSLVLEPERVNAYLGQLRFAWEGAIKHGPTELKVMDWEAVESVLRKLWRLGGRSQ
jgi:hypothetical protein